MSNDRNTHSRANNDSPESILAKKGKLPISTAQLPLLRLKQTIPAGISVVVRFGANGFVDVGVTNQVFPITDISDVARVQGSRSLAHQILGMKNKVELELVLTEAVLSLIGPVDPLKLDPTPGAVQELRRVKVDRDRVETNLSQIYKIRAVSDAENSVKTYLTDTCKTILEGLTQYAILQLTRGSEPRESIALASIMLAKGVPRSLYGKLIQPNLIDSLHVHLEHIVFGTKISKGLKLTYEELNSPVMDNKLLRSMLRNRNELTIQAACNPILAREMRLGLDEAELRRLMKIQLLMVGPGNYASEWPNPQPMPPVPFGTPGEILLKINQIEVNYHSGVIPIGMKVSQYWSNQVRPGARYIANDPSSVTLAKVLLDGKQNEQESTTGFTAHERDRDHTQLYGIAIRPVFARYIGPGAQALLDMYVAIRKGYKPQEGDVKVPPDFLGGEDLTWEELRKFLPVPGIVSPVLPIGCSPVEDVKVYLASIKGKDWYPLFVKRLFLKSSLEPTEVKVRVNGGRHQTPLPPDIFEEITKLGLEQNLCRKLAAFLMQFTSRSLMYQAYESFKAELQLLSLDGDWVAPTISSRPGRLDPEQIVNPFGEDE